MKKHRTLIISLVITIWGSGFAMAEVQPDSSSTKPGNNPQRLEWFQDQALGMFIHWSIDSQLGSVISHSMVGASDKYLNRFVNELPKTFHPTKFDPDEWARLAKLAGMKYVVFTTKHHSGFCMFDTKTTSFNIMNTPYGRDITRQIVQAFRRQDIHIGFYFSPDDFWILYKQGIDISRTRPEVNPANNQQLMQHNLAQLRELLNNYGPIDVIFLDGDFTLGIADEIKQLCWKMQPNTVITRGEMWTRDQHLPGEPIPSPWETCMTIGSQWQYKPTNENYKSGTKLIETLIEARAKGGNLLMNIGPDPYGRIPFEQERRLRELALWLFINDEAIYNIRPWHITNENNVWFTKAKDSNTVYAIVTGPAWKLGQQKTFILKSVRATDKTQIEILGQSGRTLEYRPKVNPKTTWKQDENGLHITAMRAQRIYNNWKWPNPIVLKITHAQRGK